MLVLTRRANDTIVVPSLGITIHILPSRRKTVRLGIEAPSQVEVLRGELSPVDSTTPRCDDPETQPCAPVDSHDAEIPAFSVSSTLPQSLQLSVGPAGLNAWLPVPLDAGRLWDAIQKAAGSTSTAN